MRRSKNRQNVFQNDCFHTQKWKPICLPCAGSPGKIIFVRPVASTYTPIVSYPLLPLTWIISCISSRDLLRPQVTAHLQSPFLFPTLLLLLCFDGLEFSLHVLPPNNHTLIWRFSTTNKYGLAQVWLLHRIYCGRQQYSCFFPKVKVLSWGVIHLYVGGLETIWT